MNLYTMDDCPWCTILKTRLEYADIDYIEITDMELIEMKGFATVPQLEITPGIYLDFEQSITWINKHSFK